MGGYGSKQSKYESNVGYVSGKRSKQGMGSQERESMKLLGGGREKILNRALRVSLTEVISE